MAHGLGRLKAEDPRDSSFPLAAVLPRRNLTGTKYYRTGPVLDQGRTSECVAFAWKQWLDSAPIMDKASAPPAPDLIYMEAQKVDEWAGTPHDGTSVRAGAKVMQARGVIGAYHWSTTPEDVRDYLLSTGTVVFGTDWYEGMFDPDKSGFVHPTGSVAGGHAFLCTGYRQRDGAFRFKNSWGTNWGLNGTFWVGGEDVRRLLNAQGEACAGIEVRPVK